MRLSFVVPLVLTAIVCGAGAFLSMQHLRSGALATAPQDNAVCEESMHSVVRVTDAVTKGNAYFNGERGYNRDCARAAYLRAADIDPRGSLYTWHQLGRLAFLDGKYDEALAYFGKQQEYFGDTLPNVYYMIGLTYGYRARDHGNEDDWRAAEVAFNEYIARDGASPWARTDLAWIYFAQGKFEEMKRPLEEGLRIHPTHPWLLNMYGLALLNTGDQEGARLFFKAALSSAQKMTVDDWARAYPGNAPTHWPEGLSSMQIAIEKNLALVSTEESPQ